MEKMKIDKERTWIFSPVNNIVIKVDIKGNLQVEQMKKAIKDTVYQYEMFHQRIVLDKEGNAYYQKADFFKPLIEPMKSDWKAVVKEQEKHPFAIDKGEFIRFFYGETELGISILIISHHIAGDGISFTYLVQDIMCSISGQKIENKKLELFHIENLPKEARLKAPITWLIKYMNKKWKKTGKKFDFNDYYNMYDKYWNNRDTLIYTYNLEGETYDSIYRYSKENK